MRNQLTAECRARALVRFYPPGWRKRYGDEFLMMLVDDIAERPRSLTRTVDIARTGVGARLSWAGLTGDALDQDAQVRAGLKCLSLTLVAFVAVAAAIWAQLTIGWQWSAPRAHMTTTGMVLLSAAMASFGLIAAMGAAPVVWGVVNALLSARRATLAPPLLAFSSAAFVLIDGSNHFGHGWPGTGGHQWAHQTIVPAFIARICWAATLWVSAYWAHPHALASFPASEIAWMLISPVALVIAVVSAIKIVRRVELSRRALRFEAWLGMAAGAAMAGAVAGAASWVFSSGPNPHGLFSVGAIDSVSVALMLCSLLVAFRAAQRTLAASTLQRAKT